MATKLYYTMGEVCETLCVNSSLVRYWCDNFSCLKPKRNNKGNRLFSAQDVETLKLIYHLLRDKRLTIEGANKVIKEQTRVENKVKKNISVLERLQAIKATLLEVRAALGQDTEEVVYKSEVEDNKVEHISEETPTIEVEAEKESTTIAEEVEVVEPTPQPKAEKKAEKVESTWAYEQQSLF